MKSAEECEVEVEVEILCELGEPRDRPCPFEIYDIRTHAYLVLDITYPNPHNTRPRHLSSILVHPNGYHILYVVGADSVF